MAALEVGGGIVEFGFGWEAVAVGVPVAAKKHGGDLRGQLGGGNAIQILHLGRKRPGRTLVRPRLLLNTQGLNHRVDFILVDTFAKTPPEYFKVNYQP